MGMWVQKVYYDARFTFEDDLYHRFMQICVLVVLATAVVHIRPVAEMSRAQDVFSMFLFSLIMVLGHLTTIVTWLEVYFFGVGQRKNMRSVSVLTIRFTLLNLAFSGAALAVAAAAYYGSDGDNEKKLRFLADEEAKDYDTKTGANYTDYGTDQDKYGAGDAYDTTNVPIILILVGHVLFYVAMLVNVVFFFPTGGLHKEM